MGIDKEIKSTKKRFLESLTPEERKLFDKQYIKPNNISNNELNQKFVNELSNQQREKLYNLDIISTEQYNNAVRNYKKILGHSLEKLQYMGETLNRVSLTDEDLWFLYIDDLNIFHKDNIITNSQYFNTIKRHRFIDELFNDLLNKKNISTINNRYLLGEKTDYTNISFNNFLVLSNVFRCNKHHHIEEITALLMIMNKECKIQKVEIPAGYCPECNIYFILETDYFELLKSGIPLCRKITLQQYLTNGESILDGNKLNAESLLHQIGYSVNQQDNLNSMQRQTLLKFAIDYELYSVSGLLSFIDWLIAQNKKVVTRDMSNAISKWQEDRDFVSHYKECERRIVNIDTIYTKNNLHH